MIHKLSSATYVDNLTYKFTTICTMASKKRQIFNHLFRYRLCSHFGFPSFWRAFSSLPGKVLILISVNSFDILLYYILKYIKFILF